MRYQIIKWRWPKKQKGKSGMGEYIGTAWPRNVWSPARPHLDLFEGRFVPAACLPAWRPTACMLSYPHTHLPPRLSLHQATFSLATLSDHLFLYISAWIFTHYIVSLSPFPFPFPSVVSPSIRYQILSPISICKFSYQLSGNNYNIVCYPTFDLLVLQLLID